MKTEKDPLLNRENDYPQLLLKPCYFSAVLTIRCAQRRQTQGRKPGGTGSIWLGTRQQLAKLDLAAMAVRFPHIAFSLTVRDFDSHWISSLPLLLTLTAYAATATTSCVSYVSSFALSLPLLLLLLSTPLSHLGLITAPHSTSVSLLCVWAASSALSALPRAS